MDAAGARVAGGTACSEASSSPQPGHEALRDAAGELELLSLQWASSPGSSAGSKDSDESFFMYRFKVVPCPDPEEHDCQDCPYAHPAEKATRRDPRVHSYTGVSCPSYRKGSCKDGDACRYAHGVFEVWLHPSRFRTELCKDGPSCTRKCCFFAHTPEQLRQPSPQDPCLPAPAVKKPATSIKASNSMADSLNSSGSTDNTQSSTTRWVASTAAHFSKPPSRSLTPALGLQQTAAVGGRSLGAQDVQHLYAGGGLGGLMPSAAGAPQSHLSAAGLSLGLLQQQQHVTSSAGAAGNGMVRVPLDIAAEAALLAAAAGAEPCLPALQQSAAMNHLSVLAGAGLPNMPAGLHDLMMATAGLPAPVSTGQSSHTGPGGSACSLAATAHQLITAQHQEMMASTMLQQQMLATQQQLQEQQHAQQDQLSAMWTAAWTAAKGVGLQPHEAAACADCAVKQATANVPTLPWSTLGHTAGLAGHQAGSHTVMGAGVASDASVLLLEQPGHAVPLVAALQQQQQQEQASLALMLSNSLHLQQSSHKLVCDAALGTVSPV